jgi:hypothetical protein
MGRAVLFRALSGRQKRTFFDEEGRPIVIPQEIAGLSPDQIQAQQLARGAVGVQQPFIQEAISRGQQGIDALQSGISGQALASQQALQQIQEGSRFRTRSKRSSDD